jgi:hypothetical protein
MVFESKQDYPSEYEAIRTIAGRRARVAEHALRMRHLMHGGDREAGSRLPATRACSSGNAPRLIIRAGLIGCSVGVGARPPPRS